MTLTPQREPISGARRVVRIAMAAGLVATPVLQRFRSRVDNRRYNGAALLGLRGVVFKSHGSADAYAFGQALRRTREAVVNDLLAGIGQRLDALRAHMPAAVAEPRSTDQPA